jgi:hypothetical protein
MQAPIPAESVSAELAEVLRRSELDSTPSLLERFLEWLAPRLRTDEVDALGDVLLAVMVAAAVVAGGLLVARAWRLFRSDEPEDEDAGATAEPATSARLAALTGAAAAARAAGDLRLSLRLYLHALLVALGGRGDLELRPAWTNRELLARGRLSREARALLEPLVRELEPKEFGRATVGADDVERMARLLAEQRGGT